MILLLTRCKGSERKQGEGGNNMTPYRVLAQDTDVHTSLGPQMRDVCKIYSAMLSKDKITGMRKIYILFKPIPLGYTTFDVKEIAHKMTTRKNSQIMREFIIEPFQSASGQTRYRVVDPDTYDRREIGDPQYTLSDCLVTAMHQYLYEQQEFIIGHL